MKLRRALSLVLFVLTLGSLLVQAASQGPNYAGAASTVGWTDAANATGTPDNACASRSASGGTLDLTNFGFTIPDAATINGITVEVKFAGTTAGDDGVRVRLLKGGSPVGNTQDILAISGQSDCSTSAFRTVGSPARSVGHHLECERYQRCELRGPSIQAGDWGHIVCGLGAYYC
jgi:hypothetical protein